MLALAAASLSALGGGLLVAAAIFLIWLYSGSKAHAPVHSPPQSDVDEDEESDSGTRKTSSGLECILHRLRCHVGFAA